MTTFWAGAERLTFVEVPGVFSPFVITASDEISVWVGALVISCFGREVSTGVRKEDVDDLFPSVVMLLIL